MMKLGKDAIFAIVECALFLLGAIFFILVLMIPSNPIWALIMGILCGLAGAGVWLYPHVARLFRRHQAQTNVADMAQKIQGADNPENNSYELHRVNTYDDADDEIVKKPTAPTTDTTTNTTSTDTATPIAQN